MEARVTFREWLEFALRHARFNPDAADPRTARTLEMVLREYDKSASAAFASDVVAR
jgi:hypothetical protein